MAHTPNDRAAVSYESIEAWLVDLPVPVPMSSAFCKTMKVKQASWGR